MINPYDDDSRYEERPTGRLVIDLETGLADAAALEIEAAVVKPHGSIKNEEKKAESIAKKQGELSGKNGKLDSNPIRAVGIKVEGQYIQFTWGMPLSPEETEKLIKGGRRQIVDCKSEKRMLRRFAQFCNAEFTGRAVKVIAWNGNDFDFRRLRFRYAVKRVTPPDIMAHGAGTWWIDLMKKFAEVTVNPDLKKCASLNSACLLLGVKYAKLIDGKDIPKAIEERRFAEVLESNLSDIREADAIARRLGY